MFYKKYILFLLTLLICSRLVAQEYRMPNTVQIGNLDFKTHAITYQFGKLGSIQVGDIDNDFDDDFVFSSWHVGPTIVSNKMGKFREEGVYDWDWYQTLKEIDGHNARQIVLFDFDKDGDLDLISMAEYYGVKLYVNNEFANSWAKYELIEVLGGNDIIATDLNGDGYEDVVFVGNKFGWIKNSNDGFIISENIIENDSSKSYNAVSSADVDLDGDIDLLVSSYNEIALYLNSENGEFEKKIIATGNGTVWDIAFAHLNDDEYPDILGRTFNIGSNNDILVYQNNIDSLSFKKLAINDINKYSNGRFIFSADLNMDGKNDIITGDGNGLIFIENLGENKFKTHNKVQVGFEYFDAAVLDVDNDGDLDIVTGTNNCCNDGNAMYWLENKLIVVSNETEKDVLTNYQLSQNYPNPFNPSTNIEYSIIEPSNIDISVFNLLGKKVATLVNEHKAAGTYSINFDASFLTSGIYYYRLKSEGLIITKKLTLIK